MIIPKDKIKHFVWSFLITLMIAVVFKNIYYAMLGAFLVGCAKEFWDSQGESGWDWWDIAANSAGILTFYVLYNL